MGSQTHRHPPYLAPNDVACLVGIGYVLTFEKGIVRDLYRLELEHSIMGTSIYFDRVWGDSVCKDYMGR